MNDNGIFSDRIAEWFGLMGLPSISLWEAVLVIAAVFLLLVAILWLALRKARLWYWKTEVQLNTLKNIEDRLKNVEEKVTQGTIALLETTDAEVPITETVLTPDTEPIRQKQKTALWDDGSTAVGKSGKVYTEAELEMQIRE